jgi:hypothetical protein
MAAAVEAAIPQEGVPIVEENAAAGEANNVEPHGDPLLNGGAAPEALAAVPQAAVLMGIHQLAGLGASNTAAEIRELRRQRDSIKDEQKHASLALKNATKREKRLRAKAEKLDNNDLLEVFRMRQEADAKKAKFKAKAKARADREMEAADAPDVPNA